MFSTANQFSEEIMPLGCAVFCLDCETVSNSRSDECPSCKGHSLLSLSRILGGSLRGARNEGVAGAFDITLTVELRQMHAADVNATLGRLTDVIAPRLAAGHASFHIDVRPIADHVVGKAA